MPENKLKILLIDDNPENMETVKEVLSRKLPGASVLMAETGAKGIDLARTKNPDMILLDIVMPEQDGFETCRQLKADEHMKTIPVVFVTAEQIDKESRKQAIDVGADGFLRKPFEMEELVTSIRGMVKIRAAAAVQGPDADRLRSLSKALPQVKALPRLLPICVSCKKIFNEKGYWEEVERYIKKHTNIDFTHGCCPDCAQRLYSKYVGGQS